MNEELQDAAEAQLAHNQLNSKFLLALIYFFEMF